MKILEKNYNNATKTTLRTLRKIIFRGYYIGDNDSKEQFNGHEAR